MRCLLIAMLLAGCDASVEASASTHVAQGSGTLSLVSYDAFLSMINKHSALEAGNVLYTRALSLPAADCPGLDATLRRNPRALLPQGARGDASGTPTKVNFGWDPNSIVANFSFSFRLNTEDGAFLANVSAHYALDEGVFNTTFAVDLGSQRAFIAQQTFDEAAVRNAVAQVEAKVGAFDRAVYDGLTRQCPSALATEVAIDAPTLETCTAAAAPADVPYGMCAYRVKVRVTGSLGCEDAETARPEWHIFERTRVVNMTAPCASAPLSSVAVDQFPDAVMAKVGASEAALLGRCREVISADTCGVMRRLIEHSHCAAQRLNPKVKPCATCMPQVDNPTQKQLVFPGF